MENRAENIFIKKNFNRQETDSMVNNEEERFERNINKIMTVPSKMIMRSRFQHFFFLKEKTEADNIVQGLTTSKRGTRFKSVQENANSRLITSKNLNLIDPEKYFTKVENVRLFKSACHVSYIKLDQLNPNMGPSSIAKRVFHFEDKSSDGSRFSSDRSLIKTDKDGSGNVPSIDIPNSIKDLIRDSEYDTFFDNTNEAISADQDRFVGNSITVTFTPPISQLKLDNTFISNSICPEVINDEKKDGPLANDINFFKMASSEEETNAFISDFFSMSQIMKIESISKLKLHFIPFLSATSTTQFLIKFANSISASFQVKLLLELDLVSACMQVNYSSLIDFFKSFTVSNLEIIEIILNRFDSVTVWRELISNKFGKNVVEYFIESFLQLFIYKRKKLYELLESCLVEFSKKNYATFVVQTYINKEKSKSALRTIIDNIINITSCRNGVFVLISSLKAYEGTNLYNLLDKIIDVSDSLSKNAYASTLIEYLFFNHTQYVAPNFIKKKSNCFLDIIEDNYGNYIIQKLLNVVDPLLKKELIELLSPIIGKVKKSNIKKKWIQILNNQEEGSHNTSTKSLNLSSNSLTGSINSRPGPNRSGIYQPENSNNAKSTFTSSNLPTPNNANTPNVFGIPFTNPQYNIPLNSNQTGNYQSNNPNLVYPSTLQPNPYYPFGCTVFNLPSYASQPFQPYYNYNTYYYNIKSVNNNKIQDDIQNSRK